MFFSKPQRIAKQKVGLFGLLIICFLPSNGYAQESNLKSEELSTTTPLDRMAQPWWKNRLAAKMKQKQEMESIDIVLLGDSITQGWEGTGKDVWQKTFGELNTLNLGFSGDRTEHVIWRNENGQMDDIDPGLVIVLIGTNNTGHNLDKPQAIAAGVKKILGQLKSSVPDSKILLLSVFPFDKDPESPRRKNNNELNEIIKDFHDGQSIHYLDICHQFFDDSGAMTKEITPDFLHLSAKGYQQWADGMKEKVHELLGIQ